MEDLKAKLLKNYWWILLMRTNWMQENDLEMDADEEVVETGERNRNH